MLTWTRYRCDSVHFPRLVMPEGPLAQPKIDHTPRIHKLYFLLPPGGSPRGEYTPQIVIPRNSLVKTLRSIIINALPTHSACSIEFFTPSGTAPRGWYVESTQNAILLDWQSDQTVESIANLPAGSALCVSVKVLDEALGCMVPVDPFPPPACPPKILTWNSSCA